ncbi:MAG: dockerin type I domain-containing protein [Planctomycetota bacterium]|mgnify:FL=1
MATHRWKGFVGPSSAVLLLAAALPARADVGPPVKITMPADTRPAASGRPYEGVLQIRALKEGAVEAIELEGDGWVIQRVDASTPKAVAAGEMLIVSFHAVPQDASKPVRVIVTFNGRKAAKTFDLSPAYFARAGKPRPALSRQGARASAGEGHVAGGNTIHFQGRMVYDRIGRDTDGDGVNDIPAQTVGVDRILVEIMDLDPIDDEVMWSGRTDSDGYFDVTINWDAWEDPDIYVRWECDTGTVNVQESGVLEEDYSWSTKDTAYFPDFTGSEIDFGELSPTASGDHPALHIFNSIVRAHRFIETRANLNVPEVDVQWPDEDAGGGDNAKYVGDEIFMSTARQWQEAIHIHEYGHHFLAHFAPTPPPDYCNGICDGGPAPDCPNEGHCIWCPETATIAWSEGWPNWLADVVTRSYPADYGYVALFTSNQERTRICDQDGDGVADDLDGDGTPDAADPMLIEGFIGALLRDIEDDIEDQDNDGVPDVQSRCARDVLSLGVEEIFEVVNVDEPIRPLAFINAFRARFPQHTNALWQTANNVAPEFTWSDLQPPGPVTELDSPTHPLGVGGTLPYIEIELTPPADDASGADGRYSYTWSDTTDAIPDFTEDPMPTGTSIISPLFALGEWYLRIRARDCADRWSSDSQLFGPFLVTECNGNGIVDACDTDCNAFGSFCNVPGCGYAPDCNVNSIPDACDLTDGTSSDCNLNGSPDECDGGSFVSWEGWFGIYDGLWHESFHWEGSNLPGPGDHVCIDVPSVATITHSQGVSEVLGIRSAEHFVLSGGTLTTTQRSRMESNFTVGRASLATLSGPGDIRVDGLLSFEGGYRSSTLAGSGTIDAYGGILSDGSSVRLYDSRRIRNWGPASFRGDYKELWLNDTAVFENSGTFQYSGPGDFRASGGSTSRFINLGTFEKSGPERLNVQFPFDNWNVVNVLEGTLALQGGSNIVSDGLFSGAIGAVMEFGMGLHFGPQSRVEAHNVVFRGGVNLRDITVDGTYNVTGTTTLMGVVTFTPTSNVVNYGDSLVVVAGSANFNADEPVQINHYVQSGGRANFNTGLPVTFGTLEQSGGYIKGSDAIEITGQASWSVSVLAEAVQVTAAGGMTINLNLYLQDTAVLINRATATYTGVNPPVIYLAGTSVLNNMGVFNAENDGQIGGGFGFTGRFTNSGIFNKLGPGNMTIYVVLENSGAVNILSGTLILRGAGTHTMTGSFNGPAGSTLQLGLLGVSGTTPYNFSNSSSIAIGHVRFFSTANVDGVYNVSGSTTVSGTANFSPAATVLSLGESLIVSGGTANFNCDEPISIRTFTLSGSTSATANFNTRQPVSVGQFDQTGGVLSGADEVRATGPSTWTGGTMRGAGRTVFEGNVALSGGIGLRDSRVVRSLQTASYGQNTILDMQDTARFENAGTLDALSDRDIRQFGSGSPRFTNTGTFLKRGAGTLRCSVAFRNSGTMELQAGTFEQAFRPYTQDAGVTRLNGGQLTSGLPLDLQGGVLTGTGTITASVSNNGGVVRPGLNAGLLSIVGNYTQGPGTGLQIEIGGPVAGTQFDVLSVSATATLAGDLNVVLLDGYQPQCGGVFDVLTAGLRVGVFGNVGLPTLPGIRLDIVYLADRVRLEVTCLADSDGDGDVDLDDFAMFAACVGEPDAVPPPGCESHDLDGDGDVDVEDFSILQNTFNAQ